MDDLLLPTHLHYWQSINWNQDYHLGHSCQPIYIIGYLHCFCQLICQRVSKRKPSANSTLQIVDLGIQYEKRCFWLFLSLCRTASTTHDHIGWATSMPFASINPTNIRTNLWKFHGKILRIGGAGKWGFFEAAILTFLSRPFWIFFCFISVKNPAHL